MDPAVNQHNGRWHEYHASLRQAQLAQAEAIAQAQAEAQVANQVFFKYPGTYPIIQANWNTEYSKPDIVTQTPAGGFGHSRNISSPDSLSKAVTRSKGLVLPDGHKSTPIQFSRPPAFPPAQHNTQFASNATAQYTTDSNCLTQDSQSPSLLLANQNAFQPYSAYHAPMPSDSPASSVLREDSVSTFPNQLRQTVAATRQARNDAPLERLGMRVPQSVQDYPSLSGPGMQGTCSDSPVWRALTPINAGHHSNRSQPEKQRQREAFVIKPISTETLMRFTEPVFMSWCFDEEYRDFETLTLDMFPTDDVLYPAA